MERRQEDIFNVLNEWFDIDQETFYRVWPELEKAAKPLKSDKYDFTLKVLDKQINNLMDERDAAERAGRPKRADNISDEILSLSDIRDDVYYKRQKARMKEDPYG